MSGNPYRDALERDLRRAFGPDFDGNATDQLLVDGEGPGDDDSAWLDSREPMPLEDEG